MNPRVTSTVAARPGTKKAVGYPAAFFVSRPLPSTQTRSGGVRQRAHGAFVVRMVLVAAVLSLLARAAWWMWRRLDWVLPDVDVNGHTDLLDGSHS